jgi:hypothetical protein
MGFNSALKGLSKETNLKKNSVWFCGLADCRERQVSVLNSE